MAAVLDGDVPQAAAIVVESSSATVCGSSLVAIDDVAVFSDIDEADRQAVSLALKAAARDGRSRYERIETGQGTLGCLLAILAPPPAILVLGAGLDAEPVVRFAAELGWRVTVQDHRPAYVESGDFTAAEKVLCLPVAELSDKLDLERYAAAIVMSHHLVSDREYLLQLAATGIGYIGLLGPVDRRRRLLEELGETGEQLQPRVHGPAGIDIGGRGPAAIALSIIAEAHQAIHR